MMLDYSLDETYTSVEAIKNITNKYEMKSYEEWEAGSIKFIL